VKDVKKFKEEIEGRLAEMVHTIVTGSGSDSAELKMLVASLTAMERSRLARLKFEDSGMIEEDGSVTPERLQEVLCELLGEELVP